MTCWKCQQPVEGSLRCACGALQPVPPGANPFALLGFAPRFTLPAPELERRFRELSFQVHPDRFALADPRERRIALERSTALNDAQRTLRDPVRRAEALLALRRGAEPDGPGGPPDARTERLPIEFLEEVLSLREELAEGQRAGDRAAVDRLVARVRAQRESALRDLARLLDSETPPPSDLDRAREAIAQLRYCDRFVEEALRAEGAEVRP